MSCQDKRKPFITAVFSEPNYDDQSLAGFIDEELKKILYVYVLTDAIDDNDVNASLNIMSREPLTKIDLRDILTSDSDENIRAFVDDIVEMTGKSKKSIVTKLLPTVICLNET